MRLVCLMCACARRGRCLGVRVLRPRCGAVIKAIGIPSTINESDVPAASTPRLGAPIGDQRLACSPWRRLLGRRDVLERLMQEHLAEPLAGGCHLACFEERREAVLREDNLLNRVKGSDDAVDDGEAAVGRDR